MSAEVEKPKDYVDLCSGCNQGVTRDNMVYQKGRTFHPECYTEKGTNFQTLIPDLIQESADTKIQLVYLKNLKIRQSGNTSNPSNLPTKKAVRRSTPKKKKSKRTTKRITKRKIAKRRKKKSARRTSPKKTRKRSAIRRKAKRSAKKRSKRR